MTDYFVIVDGSAEVQVRAISEAIRRELREIGVRPIGREGWADARWVLVDYGDAVVHVFQTEEREYYDLERLWGDAPRLVLQDDPTRLVVSEENGDSA